MYSYNECMCDGCSNVLFRMRCFLSCAVVLWWPMISGAQSFGINGDDIVCAGWCCLLFLFINMTNLSRLTYLCAIACLSLFFERVRCAIGVFVVTVGVLCVCFFCMVIFGSFSGVTRNKRCVLDWKDQN